jgi:hypothetical protein
MLELFLMRTALWLALGLAACSRTGEENLGLGAHAAPVDVGQLTRPAELLRALALPGAELDRRLGARHVEASSRIRMAPTDRPEQALDERYRLDSDGRGALHVVHDNDTDGMEASLVGGTLYVRPRYSKFVARRPEGDDVERLRHLVEGVAGGYLGLFERWLEVRETGRVEVAGHGAIRLALTARSSPTGTSLPSEPGKRWRAGVRVRHLDGELVLDAASGALLEGKLEAVYELERSDLPGPLSVSLSFRQSTSAAQPISAPSDAVPSPRRPRPLLDRQALLDGLTPGGAR